MNSEIRRHLAGWRLGSRLLKRGTETRSRKRIPTGELPELGFGTAHSAAVKAFGKSVTA